MAVLTNMHFCSQGPSASGTKGSTHSRDLFVLPTYSSLPDEGDDTIIT